MYENKDSESIPRQAQDDIVQNDKCDVILNLIQNHFKYKDL